MAKSKKIYREGGGTKPDKRNISQIIVAVILLSLGLYLLLLLFSPKIDLVNRTPDVQAQSTKADGENSIIIPKIGVNIEYKTGDESVLDDYAWHRYPERGNPEIGGNFIISAHRFKVGFSPGETRRRSPFYNIEQLQVGDKVYTRFNKKMYEYKISKRYDVKPDAIEIEAPSDTPKLTIYSCTLGGSADGRVVIEAKPMFDTNQTKNDKTARN